MEDASNSSIELYIEKIAASFNERARKHLSLDVSPDFVARRLGSAIRSGFLPLLDSIWRENYASQEELAFVILVLAVCGGHAHGRICIHESQALVELAKCETDEIAVFHATLRAIQCEEITGLLDYFSSCSPEDWSSGLRAFVSGAEALDAIVLKSYDRVCAWASLSPSRWGENCDADSSFIMQAIRYASTSDEVPRSDIAILISFLEKPSGLKVNDMVSAALEFGHFASKLLPTAHLERMKQELLMIKKLAMQVVRYRTTFYDDESLQLALLRVEESIERVASSVPHIPLDTKEPLRFIAWQQDMPDSKLQDGVLQSSDSEPEESGGEFTRAESESTQKMSFRKSAWSLCSPAEGTVVARQLSPMIASETMQNTEQFLAISSDPFMLPLIPAGKFAPDGLQSPCVLEITQFRLRENYSCVMDIPDEIANEAEHQRICELAIQIQDEASKLPDPKMDYMEKLKSNIRQGLVNLDSLSASIYMQNFACLLSTQVSEATAEVCEFCLGSLVHDVMDELDASEFTRRAEIEAVRHAFQVSVFPAVGPLHSWLADELRLCVNTADTKRSNMIEQLVTASSSGPFALLLLRLRNRLRWPIEGLGVVFFVCRRAATMLDGAFATLCEVARDVFTKCGKAVIDLLGLDDSLKLHWMNAVSQFEFTWAGEADMALPKKDRRSSVTFCDTPQFCTYDKLCSIIEMPGSDVSSRPSTTDSHFGEFMSTATLPDTLEEAPCSPLACKISPYREEPGDSVDIPQQFAIEAAVETSGGVTSQPLYQHAGGRKNRTSGKTAHHNLNSRGMKLKNFICRISESRNLADDASDSDISSFLGEFDMVFDGIEDMGGLRFVSEWLAKQIELVWRKELRGSLRSQWLKVLAERTLIFLPEKRRSSEHVLCMASLVAHSLVTISADCPAQCYHSLRRAAKLVLLELLHEVSPDQISETTRHRLVKILSQLRPHKSDVATELAVEIHRCVPLVPISGWEDRLRLACDHFTRHLPIERRHGIAQQLTELRELQDDRFIGAVALCIRCLASTQEESSDNIAPGSLRASTREESRGNIAPGSLRASTREESRDNIAGLREIILDQPSTPISMPRLELANLVFPARSVPLAYPAASILALESGPSTQLRPRGTCESSLPQTRCPAVA